MERSQRIGLIAVALVVAAVAFFVLKGDDDDETGGSTTAQTTTVTETVTETVTGAEEPAETTEPEPEPEVEPPTIRIKAGEPVGGVQDIEVNKGDRLVFAVRSDAAHEIHLHGYDIEQEVEAGGQLRFSLKADIEGIFEVEIEDLGEQIAEVRVNP